MFPQSRKLIQVIALGLEVINGEWMLRGVVLISLSLQIILAVIGDRRKYIPKNWIRIVIWSAYLGAESVATYSINILAYNATDIAHSLNFMIMALWAPFLLLHLGGPDTIVAYSLEDNALWMRALFDGISPLFQVGYVLWISSSNTSISLAGIAVFIASSIKFGERIWALRSANYDKFRKSLIPDADPGPNYANFMEDYASKKFEGYILTLQDIGGEEKTDEEVDASQVSETNGELPGTSNYVEETNDFEEATILKEAYDLLDKVKKLFADLVLSVQDRQDTKLKFGDKIAMNHQKAFKIVEIELSIMFDLFYTKEAVTRSGKGIFLRFLSLSSTACAFVVFWFIDMDAYATIDVIISFLLLAGALVLEVYAILLFLSSDWTVLRFHKVGGEKAKKIVSCLVSFFRRCHLIPSSKRWSNSIRQHNLISRALKYKLNKGGQPAGFFGELLEEYWYADHVRDIEKENLKEKIFQQLRDNEKENLSCLDKRDLDKTIILWHIATDICYYEDFPNNHGEEEPRGRTKAAGVIAKLLSDYMLYLLVRRPTMLPKGIGQIRFQDTLAEAAEFIRERKYISDEVEACQRLRGVQTTIQPSRVKGERSKSVLFDACIVAKDLRPLERDEKWDKISKTWIEMLSYAAGQCEWYEHAEQLRRGGELLSHVWLLMAHLGMTDHSQISEEQKAVKLLAN